MGNPKRWFVDNGSKQGFLPADILNPIGDEEMKAIHAYDDVAEDESVDAKIGDTEVNAMETNSSEISSKPEENNACHESTTTTANNDDSKDNDTKKQQMPVRKAPPVPSSQQKQSTDPSDQRSNHSYEEIAASEVASEVRVIFDLLQIGCCVSQCGNLKIFVSLGFYVKSILKILEVQNLPF